MKKIDINAVNIILKVLLMKTETEKKETKQTSSDERKQSRL